VRAIFAIVGLLFALGARAAVMKWECSHGVSETTVLWLSGDLEKGDGEVRTSRMVHTARFATQGLLFVWAFADGSRRFELQVAPDGEAKLYDFTGAAPNQSRASSDIYQCKET
jgi:hypothetical protein